MSNSKLSIALKQDILNLSRNPPPGILSASPVDDNQLIWHALIQGPTNTIFERGVFRVYIELSKDYPGTAPKAIFLSEIYHPNIFLDGEVCMDILNHNWNEKYRIREVLLSLSALLADPNPNDPANYLATEDFKKHPQNPNYRRKVLEVVEKSEAYFPKEGDAAKVNYNIVRRDREKYESQQRRENASSCSIQ